MLKPIRLLSQPGIKRDGTVLEGEAYIDGEWCRFQRGLPRKMGGFARVTDTVPELVRGMASYSANGLQYVHLGSNSKLGQYRVNNLGNFAGFSDRTPAALSASSDNLWQFDHFYDSVGLSSVLVAHAAPNLSAIDSTTTQNVWYGTATATGILVNTGLPAVSGGIVALSPYLMTYGNNGSIGWTNPNNLATLASTAYVTPQKVVKGLPLRGTGGGPAGLFWSLDSLIRATFVGGTSVWQFDTLSAESSILSSQAVIEYDGLYFWPGVDRFLMFNGVVREVPNQFNQNFFFDNVNFEYRQKVFAFKVPRFGEIWWCFPHENDTECTHAVIYNLREETWYDTVLPNGGRSAGLFAKVYNKPFMVDVDYTSTPGYTLWQHETGTDKVQGGTVNPVYSFFETAEISLLTAEQAMDKSLRVARIETDFVQSGDMTVSVRGRANAKAPFVQGDSVTIPEIAATGTDETVKLKEIRRLMSFKFESNAQGGHYEMGQTIAHIEPADGRIES